MKKFYIYRNLRTGGFSVRHGGKVINRFDTAEAHNVTFKVNEGGRQDTLKRKQKTVHAFVVADRVTEPTGDLNSLALVSYNPYNGNTFKVGEAEIKTAKSVLFFNGKCYVQSHEQN